MSLSEVVKFVLKPCLYMSLFEVVEFVLKLCLYMSLFEVAEFVLKPCLYMEFVESVLKPSLYIEVVEFVLKPCLYRYISHLTSHFEVVEFVVYHRQAFLECGLEDEAEDAVGAVGDLVQVQKEPGDTESNRHISHHSLCWFCVRMCVH